MTFHDLNAQFGIVERLFKAAFVVMGLLLVLAFYGTVQAFRREQSCLKRGGVPYNGACLKAETLPPLIELKR